MRVQHPLLWIVCLSLFAACSRDRVGEPLPRRGLEISVAGQLFHAGTRVVLWNDPGGHDAYRLERKFAPELPGPSQSPKQLARYDSFRGGLSDELSARVRRDGWRLEDLQKTVSQVVIHYDQCGTSRKCFEVLHDLRGLSCHFLLDLDGTIYQTLDLKERAWHAAQANSRSIGIEIANIGAYQSEEPLRAWYAKDSGGVRITIPAEVGESGLPKDFVGRPARPDLIRGQVNGKELVQQDFTELQYRALEKLLVALSRIFPRIAARAPLGSDGKILDRAFASNDDLHAFEGVIGHWHVTQEKVDPGPAFDWQRILRAMK